MLTIKKIFAWLYFYFLQTPLRAFARLLARFIHLIEKKCLGYCYRGCENCFKWECLSRRSGETPYRKFRRGKLKKD